MSSQSVAYALGGTLTEQQRLIAQAQGLEMHAKWLLDQTGVAASADISILNRTRLPKDPPNM